MQNDFKDLAYKLKNIKMKNTPTTFLQILGKPHSEVLTSKYLEFILDERNTSRDILKQILKATQRNAETNFIELLESSAFEDIKTEDSISAQSRLDIIIKYSNLWIVIENKIHAFESRENQTLDYEKQLNLLNSNNIPIKYIYLKPNYNKSHPSNDHFAEMNYSELFEILTNIKQNELRDKDSYLFLQDFIKHTKEFFMKGNQIDFNDEALQVYFENKNKIDYVIENYKVQSLKLKTLLLESISARFPDFKIYNTIGFIQIFKENWQNHDNTGIHFEILPDKSNLDSLLGTNKVKLNFVLHNEKNTKLKYPSIKSQLLSSKEFMFNNNEKIQESLENILLELKKIINTHADSIDLEIAKLQ